MKKIKQEVVVTFKNLEFSDKVILLPIMDQLMNAARENGAFAMQALGSPTAEIRPESVRRVVKVLSDLGFRDSRGEGYGNLPTSDRESEKYVEIRWPNIQYLMEEDGFKENSILDSRENAESSTYLVAERWLNTLSPDLLAKVF